MGVGVRRLRPMLDTPLLEVVIIILFLLLLLLLLLNVFYRALHPKNCSGRFGDQAKHRLEIKV